MISLHAATFAFLRGVPEVEKSRERSNELAMLVRIEPRCALGLTATAPLNRRYAVAVRNA
jgi:hypothetical protein